MITKTAAVEYQTEIRFGVVMYGGVSLAVYINGVSHELFEMACATPLPGVTIGPEGASASREIYDRLSWLAGNPTLVDFYAQRLSNANPAVDPWDEALAQARLNGLERTRFVIDVIAGTSAGGINGVYLAKALVNGEHFGALRDLWIKEGDIGLLLNDAKSREGLPPGLPGKVNEPKSLLNSDRMYLKLLAALDQMQALPVTRAPDRVNAAAEPMPSPLVEELDLYLTTTDIRGTPVPLRLFDRVVNERRHKQHFHSSYPSAEWPLKTIDRKHDFDAQQHAFLAFTARCTSSFPFAFEPMTLRRVAEVLPFETVDRLRRFDGRFKSFGEQTVELGRHVDLPFGDGGYLDNKPFSYVAETLSHRFGDAPARRKLIYVEPDPGWLDIDKDPRRHLNPDALTNAYEALFTIPTYETIREDLATVLARNRRIERVEGLVHDVEAAIEEEAGPRGNPFAEVKLDDQNQLREWRTLQLKDMVKFFGRAVVPYRELRVYAVTDRLAVQVAQAWGIDTAGDRFHALRAVVRHWRATQFGEAKPNGPLLQPYNEFLYSFDFDYRLRRTAFLIQRMDRLRGVLERHGALDEASRLDRLDDTLILAVARHWGSPGNPDGWRHPDTLVQAVQALTQTKRQLRLTYLDMLRWRRAPPDLGATLHLSREALFEALADLIADDHGQSIANDFGNAPSTPVERFDARLTQLLKRQDPGVLAVLAMVTQAMQCLRIAAPAVLGKTTDDGFATLPLRHPRRLLRTAWQLLGEPKLEARAVEGRKGVWHASLVTKASPVDASSPNQWAINTAGGHWMKRVLGESFLLFDLLDQMRFTLYYETDTGEPTQVDVVRISPIDATRLVEETSLTLPDQRKLAGNTLAHFSAFLDERWRRNDVLWGRLDGAERLIAALLPATDEATRKVRGELIDLAHRRILRETLVPKGEDELSRLLQSALLEVQGDQLEIRLTALMQQLKLGGRLEQSRLREVLMALLDEQGLVQHFKEHRLIDRQPEPKATLTNAARAITITGKILQGISAGNKGTPTSAMARWIARTGLVMQSLVAVSLPGSFKQLWWSSALLFVYSVEVLALVAGWLFSLPGLTQGALLSAGLTIGLHLITLVLRDQMRERRRWLGGIGLVVALALLGLAALGARSVYQSSLHSVLCELQTDSTAARLLNFYCQ